MNPKVTDIGKIVLAPFRWRRDHGYDGGVRRDIRQGARDLDVDCTYGIGPAFMSWAAEPGHTLDRLWAFSTGSWWVPKLKDPTKPRTDQSRGQRP